MKNKYLDPKEVEANTDQQEICKLCRWCCDYKAISLGCLNKEQMELYIVQGLKPFYNHNLLTWEVLVYNPCPYLTDDGCSIYTSDERPETCKTFICPHPDGSHPKYMEEACEAGRKFLLDKFKKEKDNGVLKTGGDERSGS